MVTETGMIHIAHPVQNIIGQCKPLFSDLHDTMYND